ncbi:DsbA family protein [Actinocorallia populi]|uniref:DsbA family protein n=1 Tax=Actinocorallia populi TaxID=2079200 RepID=UPI001E48F180|nr:thioredoxin domain-containing protein [Actinocorallia populi]
MSKTREQGDRRERLQVQREQERRQAARRRNITLSLSVIAVFVVIAAGFFAFDKWGKDTPKVAAGESLHVRSDSHRLSTAADGKVTLVEFLDFECEACRAYFPAVEELREEYDGKVTFVARYFPLPGHFNAERAARAVEASAQQGKFEAMYKKMYETQMSWGEQRVPADEVFRGFAQGLGLDMAAWEKAYNAPETLERIKKDIADGRALGVQGTPSFFLNGEKIQPRSVEEFRKAIDAALTS